MTEEEEQEEQQEEEDEKSSHFEGSILIDFSSTNVFILVHFSSMGYKLSCYCSIWSR